VKRLRVTLSPTMTMSWLVVLTTTLGCDDRASRIAREAADRQAEQNRTMARLEHEIAAGARQLVEAEGHARRQTLEIHHGLQAERSQMAGAWSDLERERQSVARSRRTESFWVAVLPAGGGALVAVLALVLAWIVLTSLRHDDDSAVAACQLLLDEIVDHANGLHEALPTRLPALPDGHLTRLLHDASSQSSPLKVEP
jgi:hypothetical protein